MAAAAHEVLDFIVARDLQRMEEEHQRMEREKQRLEREHRRAATAAAVFLAADLRQEDWLSQTQRDWIDQHVEKRGLAALRFQQGSAEDLAVFWEPRANLITDVTLRSIVTDFVQRYRRLAQPAKPDAVRPVKRHRQERK
jgi:hypothetical protein